MWSTIIYIIFLILGIVGMAYYLYNGIRNKKLKEEGKEGKDNLWLMGVSIALMTVPINVGHLLIRQMYCKEESQF